MPYLIRYYIHAVVLHEKCTVVVLLSFVWFLLDNILFIAPEYKKKRRRWRFLINVVCTRLGMYYICRYPWTGNSYSSSSSSSSSRERRGKYSGIIIIRMVSIGQYIISSHPSYNTDSDMTSSWTILYVHIQQKGNTTPSLYSITTKLYPYIYKYIYIAPALPIIT